VGYTIKTYIKRMRNTVASSVSVFCNMSQPPPHEPTSKTAKKHAAPPPTQIVADEEKKTRPSVRRKTRRQFEVPRVTFRRLIHEIASEYKSDLRFQREAYEALQEAAENLVSERFGRCSQLASLCKLDTVRDEHWRFVQGDGVPCLGTS
jgi:histone H3/H4